MKARKLPKSCSDIFDENWTRVCNGNYPSKIIEKYVDKLMTAGEPYVVFKIKESVYLISMGESAIFNETQIALNVNGTFVNPKTGKTIENVVALTCLPYRFRYTEELVANCLYPENMSDANYTILNYPLYEKQSMQAQMKYGYQLGGVVDDEPSCAIYSKNFNWWIAVFIGLLLCWAIISSRFRI